MKPITNILIIVTAFAALGFTPMPAITNCDDESFLDQCMVELKDYNFLKAFRLNNKSGTSPEKTLAGQYSYVFSKSTDYKITVNSVSGNGGCLVVNLLDRNKKLVGTSYDKKTKKNFPAIYYKCTATGVYYLEFYFEGENPCGVCILASRK